MTGFVTPLMDEFNVTKLSVLIRKGPVWVYVFIPTKQRPHLSLVKATQLIKQMESGVVPALLEQNPAPTPALCRQDWTPLLYKYINK